VLGETARCKGVVAWCRKQADDYLTGIAFLDAESLFRARMVEQVCQIERYRQQCEQQAGHSLAVEDVARQWVERYAADFPQPG